MSKRSNFALTLLLLCAVSVGPSRFKAAEPGTGDWPMASSSDG